MLPGHRVIASVLVFMLGGFCSDSGTEAQN